MGARKHIRAEERKEAKKNQYFARLSNCPIPARKMRLAADLIRGESVERALHLLKTSPGEAPKYLYKVVLSAIANWQGKNEGVRLEESTLYIQTLTVDSARTLKRIRPAPQGRAHRIRKRSCHVNMYVANRMQEMEDVVNEAVEQTEENKK
ncbi:MAG: 50S ribosomal protein L22 [Bacteroidales bacterium]|nr:50S ribosomal protein L22 [Bacteroidales bacterium]